MKIKSLIVVRVRGCDGLHLSTEWPNDHRWVFNVDDMIDMEDEWNNSMASAIPYIDIRPVDFDEITDDEKLKLTTLKLRMS